MKNLKLVILIALLVVFILGFIGIYVYFNQEKVASSIPSTDQAQFVGKFISTPNNQLSINIDKYFEQLNQMYCSHVLYGYDDKYAYTWIYCSAYINAGNGEIKESSGFSVPTRFEFDKNTLEIKGYKQPQDGERYDSTYRNLFPLEVYTPTILNISEYNKRAEKLNSEAKAKYLKSLNQIN
jgi:hypothetical protein